MNQPNIDQEDFDLAQEYITGFGIEISKTQLSDLLDENPRLAKELSIGGFDTVVREIIRGTISEKFIGQPWPSYADNLSDEEMENFVESIRVSAEKQGYKLTE